jgi:regulator of nonsense transcripts 2
MCPRLSELLYLPLPPLPTESQKSDSILIGTNNANNLGDDFDETLLSTRGKWEDEEERRFFEDIQDLKDFVPKSVLGIDEDEPDKKEKELAREQLEQAKVAEEVKKLEEELEVLKTSVEGRSEDGAHEAEPVNQDILQEDEDG